MCLLLQFVVVSDRVTGLGRQMVFCILRNIVTYCHYRWTRGLHWGRSLRPSANLRPAACPFESGLSAVSHSPENGGACDISGIWVCVNGKCERGAVVRSCGVGCCMTRPASGRGTIDSDYRSIRIIPIMMVEHGACHRGRGCDKEETGGHQLLAVSYQLRPGLNGGVGSDLSVLQADG